MIVGSSATAAPSGGAVPPPSKSKLDASITAASNQLEIVVEQYDAARVALAGTKAKLATVNTKLAPMHRSVAAAQARVSTIAASVYQAPSIGQFGSLLESSSTSNLIDQLGFIDQVAVARQQQINALYAAAHAYVDQQKSLSQLTIAQTLEYRQLKAKRTSITSQIAQLKSLRLAAYGQTGNPPSDPVSTFVPVFSPDMAGRAVKFAFDQLGKPYKWASAGPNSYDCSGLTLASWRSVGVKLPHNAAMQYQTIKHITRSELEPGDLVFYFNPVHHVGIYLGSDKIINAPTYGRPVQVAPLDMAPIHGYGRP